MQHGLHRRQKTPHKAPHMPSKRIFREFFHKVLGGKFHFPDLHICIIRSTRRFWHFWPLTRMQVALLRKRVFKKERKIDRKTDRQTKKSRALGRKINEIEKPCVYV